METLLNLQPSYKPAKLKTLPLRDQPAYRVAANAIGCNLAELLAAVVGGAQQIEIAEDLMSRFGGDIQRLYKANVTEIAEVHGIGQQTAVRIKAALVLGIKVLEPSGDRPIINSPGDAAALVQLEMSLLEQEHLKVMLLDTRNRVLDIVEVYHGSVNSSQVRIAEVLRPVIRQNAPAFIVAHNHPSGDPTPSPDDVAVTRAIHQACRLMSIDLLDHLVIGGSRYVSLKERGLGFS
jgi:DNA repair protein RadC